MIRNGQLLLTSSTERLQAAVEYENDVVRLLRPEARTPTVTMDPGRSFGQPAVRGVRTDALAEDYRAGTSRDELADLYDLTLAQVDQAIRFELIAGSRHAA